jgi:hypothetical protein
MDALCVQDHCRAPAQHENGAVALAAFWFIWVVASSASSLDAIRDLKVGW